MSIKSVSNLLLPYHGPLAVNSPPTAKAAGLAKEATDPTAPKEAVTRAMGSGSVNSGRDAPAVDPSGDAPDARVESALERALRQARVATGNSQDAPGSASGRSAPAIGLYQRVSQYSDNGSSVSGLIKSWNDIVRERQFDESTVAGHVKAVAQNDTLGLQSGILHLTA
jgi:hypothetical protein